MDTEISLATTGTLTKREYDESQLLRSSEDELDRSAFLTLLTTQLQNQNPLDPMKNEAFVAQLAQFSQLEGITNMSTSLSDVADVIRSDRILSGSNLVGKSVFAQTGRITLETQSPQSIEVDLPYGAEQVDLGIFHPTTGALMRSIVSGPQSSGIADFAWDGRLADGSQAPFGNYIIRATATVNGNATTIVPSTFSRVETVSWDPRANDLILNLSGGSQLPISAVSRIGDSLNKQAVDAQTEKTGE